MHLHVYQFIFSDNLSSWLSPPVLKFHHQIPPQSGRDPSGRQDLTNWFALLIAAFALSVTVCPLPSLHRSSGMSLVQNAALLPSPPHSREKKLPRSYLVSPPDFKTDGRFGTSGKKPGSSVWTCWTAHNGAYDAPLLHTLGHRPFTYSILMSQELSTGLMRCPGHNM